MTRKEKEKAIDALKISAPVIAMTQKEFDDYIKTLNKIVDWLEQEKSETVTEFADRCRECGAKYGKLLKQESCKDAISRQAVNILVDELARAISDERCCISRGRSTATIMQDILDLPPINPQSCGDCISRQAVLEYIKGSEAELGHSSENELVCQDIKEFPPVNPQPKWIPISKRLPEENKTVIASTKYGVYPEARYAKEYGWEWAYESGADYWRKLEDVTAWMLLPKQYEPQESEG